MIIIILWVSDIYFTNIINVIDRVFPLETSLTIDRHSNQRVAAVIGKVPHYWSMTA